MLNELAAVSLPVEGVVKGVLVLDTAVLGYWSDRALWRLGPFGAHRMCERHLRRPLTAMWLPDRHAVAVLDGDGPRVLTEEGSRCRSTSIKQRGMRVFAAARGLGGWIAAGATDSFRGMFRRRDEDRNWTVLSPRVPGFSDSSWAHVLLSADSTGLIVSERGWPFTSAVIGPGGQIETVMRPIVPRHLDTARDSVPFARWTSSGAFRLDRGFVMVLSDLTSDRRVVALLDSLGATLRVTRVEAPFGLVATTPARHELLALRRLGSAELVRYSWKWEGSTQMNTNDRR